MDSIASQEPTYVTEQIPGFLGDFLAEYSERLPPTSGADRTVEIVERLEAEVSSPQNCSLPHNVIADSKNETPEADIEKSTNWRSESDTFVSDFATTEDEGDRDVSTAAETEDWEDEDPDTPGSPGSDFELKDGTLRRGMYITIILSNQQWQTAVPCTAKILDVVDKRGKITVRLTKSARRAARKIFANPQSPAARGRQFS